MKYNLKEKLKNLIEEWLFPKDIKCIICDDELPQKTHFSVCQKCEDKLPYITGKTCNKCGLPIDNMARFCLACKTHSFSFSKNVSVFEYTGIARKMVRELKYDNKKYLSNYMSNFLVKTYIENSFDCDFIIPVPMSQKRLEIRGYNQAELLCQSLSQVLSLEIVTTSLLKIKHTSTQTNLSKVERENNVLGAFKVVEKNKITGKTILLVDDVYTTGSTLNECAKVLISAGAKKVYCITFAHAKRVLSV